MVYIVSCVMFDNVHFYVYHEGGSMPIRYSSNDLIRIVTDDGWRLKTVRGSHHKYNTSIRKNPALLWFLILKTLSRRGQRREYWKTQVSN